MKEETRITVKEIFCVAPKRSQVYQHCYEIFIDYLPIY